MKTLASELIKKNDDKTAINLLQAIINRDIFANQTQSQLRKWIKRDFKDNCKHGYHILNMQANDLLCFFVDITLHLTLLITLYTKDMDNIINPKELYG